MELVHGILYTMFAFLLLTTIGNGACKVLFAVTGLNGGSDTTDDVQPAGWIIGSLERTVLAIGIVTQSWEVLAAVIALKTVTRFKELDEQKFAEYFLVGSLFSILWSVLVTSAWLLYDGHVGSNLRAKVSGLFEISDQASGTCLSMHSNAPRIEFCGNDKICVVQIASCAAEELQTD